MSKEILLQAKSVSVRYPGSEKNALESIFFDVYRGEILMLAGGSGSGKSTLLGLLSGLLPGLISIIGRHSLMEVSDKHGVPKTEETVPLPDGFLISV